jgi:hypothetical protein
MEWLAGYKTYIVFAVVLLNGILNLFGWGLELPEAYQGWVEIVLSAVALILRALSYVPGVIAKRRGLA